ncbi:MAG: sulfite exporter TauE/SafE family protein [Phycisphaerales bacterium]|nr:sulfite exporter TauE/SafE family protein [Phycisphaerales bacterium]
MPVETLIILAALFLVVGALYSSVGHAGASGYLAVMTLMNFAPESMRPTALSVNILVAAIAFLHFRAAGYFSWPLAWPFVVTAPTAAFFGAALPLGDRAVTLAIGFALLLASARMASTCVRDLDGDPATLKPPRRGAALGSGAVIGLLSGITGTGGGIFLSPLMLLRRWANPKQVAATSALFIFCNSVAGLGGLALDGWRPTPGLALLALAGCVGGAVGARFGSRYLGFRWLRGLLALVVLLASLKLIAS